MQQPYTPQVDRFAFVLSWTTDGKLAKRLVPHEVYGGRKAGASASIPLAPRLERAR